MIPLLKDINNKDKLLQIMVLFNLVYVYISQMKIILIHHIHTIYMFTLNLIQFIIPQFKICQKTQEYNIKNYDIDYNQWIKEGVSYIQQIHYDELRSIMIENDINQDIENQQQLDFLFQNIQQYQQEQTTAQEQLLQEWYEDANQVENLVINNLRKNPKEYLLQYQKTNLPLCKASLQQNAQFVNTITFRKISQQDKERELEQIYGFTDIINTLYQSNVPIITHNGFNTHLCMYNTFIAPLPENYEEFKQNIRDNYPCIYDTKLIFDKLEQVFLNSTLQFIQDYMLSNQNKFQQQKVVILWPDQPEYRAYLLMEDIDPQQLLDAGNDATNKGWIYLHLLHAYGQERINRFQNQIYLFNSDFIINTRGDDIQTNTN